MIHTILELMGKNWEIMNALSEGKYCGAELADMLHKVPPEISKSLKDLRREGLVDCERIEGRKEKPAYLTNRGRRMVKAINEAMLPEPEGRLEKWQIDQLLEILENKDIDESSRKSYIGIFDTLSREYPRLMIEHTHVRRLIRRLVTKGPTDEINENLNKSIPILLSQAVQLEIGRKWVLEKVFPHIVKRIESGDEKQRKWAVRQITSLAVLGKDPELMANVRNRLLKVWFSDKTDALTDAGSEVRRQIGLLCLKGNSTNAQIIFREAQIKVRSQDPHIRDKAETLLDSLKTCLLPKDVQMDHDKKLEKEQIANNSGKYALSAKNPT